MANYSFQWYVGSVDVANQIGDNNNVLDNTDAGFVGAGVYWVEITKNGGTPGGGDGYLYPIPVRDY